MHEFKVELNSVGSALRKVYRLTEKVTKKILMRAEDAILEVN